MKIRWSRFLFCALLLYVSSCAQVVPRKMSKENQKRNDIGKYSWGPECVDGLEVGLLVEGGLFRPDTSIPWRWAIRNNRDSIVEVTVRHDSDPAFRYRLVISRPGAREPLWEFTPPPGPRSTAIHGTQVAVFRDAPAELDGGTASIDQAWGPGTYNLQLVFGGNDFNFSCRSGIVQIEVR